MEWAAFCVRQKMIKCFKKKVVTLALQMADKFIIFGFFIKNASL